MNPTPTIRLTHDDEPDRVIRGWVDLPAGAGDAPRSCVVVLHGFKGFAHWGFFPELARRLAGAGHVAVRIDASGSGVGEDPLVIDRDEAFARNTVSREIEDLERVRAWLAAGGLPEVDPARLGFLGHSMGGGVGLLHAARHGGWRSLVTWAAVGHFARVDGERLEEWRRRGWITFPNARTGQEHRLDWSWVEDIETHRHDVAAACRALSVPTLLLHGEEDESVPLAEGQALAAALAAESGRLETVPGAGHTFGAVHPLDGCPPPLERALASTLAHFARHLGDSDGPDPARRS